MTTVPQLASHIVHRALKIERYKILTVYKVRELMKSQGLPHISYRRHIYRVDHWGTGHSLSCVIILTLELYRQNG